MSEGEGEEEGSGMEGQGRRKGVSEERSEWAREKGRREGVTEKGRRLHLVARNVSNEFLHFSCHRLLCSSDNNLMKIRLNLHQT